jgi:hypothetical protein
MREVYRQELMYIPQVELKGTKLKLRIDEGSASSHSLYEKNAIQYLKNKGVIQEYPLDPPSIYPSI